MHQRVYGSLEPFDVSPLAEVRGNDISDDPPGLGIRDLPLQSVTDLNSHPPVLNRRHNENPVVVGTFSYLPFLKKRDGNILDRAATERWEDGDGDLVGSLALIDRQAFLQAVSGCLVENRCEIVDKALRRRECGGNQQEEKRKESQ